MDGNRETHTSLSAKGQRWRLAEPHRLHPEPISHQRAVTILSKRYGAVPTALAVQRYATREQAEQFLSTRNFDDFLKQDFPKISRSLKDFEASAARLADAVERGQKIGISGDYDCDGNCSVALLCRFLLASGVKTDRIFPHIPNRMREGYGVNKMAVKEMKDHEVDLMLALDNGTLAFDPIAYATSNVDGRKMDVIVADHHPNESGQELPDNALVVNPNRYDDDTNASYPGINDIAAVGVTYLIALRATQILQKRNYYRDREIPVPNTYNWLSLVATATIGDVVNVSSPINRMLVKEGLKAIEDDDKILQLTDVAQQKAPPDEETIAFQLAPIINAPGRLGQSVAWSFLSGFASESSSLSFSRQKRAMSREIYSLEKALDALSTERRLDRIAGRDFQWHFREEDTAPSEKPDELSQAEDQLLRKLANEDSRRRIGSPTEERLLMLMSKECNEKRKLLEGELTKIARKQAEEILREDPDRQTLLVSGKGWHEGVIGIVASRLKETFNRPVVVASIDEEGQCKCSARSIKVPDHPVDIGTVFRQLKEEGVLSKAGGHPMAAGASFQENQLDRFEQELESRLGPAAQAARQAHALEVNAVIDLMDLKKAHGNQAEAKLIEMLKQLDGARPFGEGNRKPTIVLKNVLCEKTSILKHKHISLTIRRPGHLSGWVLPAMAFHSANTDLHRAISTHGHQHSSNQNGEEALHHALGTFQIKEDKQGKETVQFFIEDLCIGDPKQPGKIPCLQSDEKHYQQLFAIDTSTRQVL